MRTMRLVLSVALAAVAAATFAGAQSRTSAERAYDEAVYVEQVTGDVKRAIEMYRQVQTQFGNDPEIAEKARQREIAARSQTTPGTANAPEQLILDLDGRAIFDTGRTSPDGRYVPRVTRQRLVLRDTVTGTDRDITQPSARTTPEDFFFTADSKSVIYTWYDGTSDTFQLRRVDVDGRNERVLIPDFAGGPGAASPDGRVIAVPVRREGVHQIVLVEISSRKLRTLRSLEWRGPEVGNFSPDGRFLVYSVAVRQGAPDRAIHIAAVDGSSDELVVPGTATNRDPLFSPDGRHVVFSSNRSGGRWDLWSVAIENGKPRSDPRLIRANIGPVALLGISAAGDLFFRTIVDERDVFEATVDPKTWRVVGTPRRISERFAGASFAPRWSGDGSSLAYLALRGHSSIQEAGEVLVVVRDGRSDERSYPLPGAVAVADAFPNAIQWFPDRKSLLFTAYGDPGRQFLRLDLASGLVTTMFTARQSVLSTIVTPDGTAIVYPSTDADDPQTAFDERRNKRLIRRDLSSGTERTILEARTGGNGSAAFHALSIAPDGRRIAYISTPTVWIGSLGSGEVEKVADITGIQVFSAVWDLAGRGVLVNVSANQNNEIWYVPVDGRQPHTIGISMPSARISSVHPDGRIAFTAGTSTTQVRRINNVDLNGRASR